MTLEEAILFRSYLPKNGTYTMTDHILAMTMDVTGQYIGDVKTVEDKIGVTVRQVTVPMTVAESKATLKVIDDKIALKMSVQSDSIKIK